MSNDRLKEIFEREQWGINSEGGIWPMTDSHNKSLDRVENAVLEYIRDLELDKESAAMRIAECEAEIERLEDEEEKALEERQVKVPKVVVPTSKETSQSDGTTEKWGCEICGGDVYEHDNFCPDCGTKLDWTEIKGEE